MAVEQVTSFQLASRPAHCEEGKNRQRAYIRRLRPGCARGPHAAEFPRPVERPRLSGEQRPIPQARLDPYSTAWHAGHASLRSVPWRKRWQTGQWPLVGSESAWLGEHGGQRVQHLTDDTHAVARGPPPPFRRSDGGSLHRMRLGLQTGHGNEAAARWAACECLLPHAVRNGGPVVPSRST